MNLAATIVENPTAWAEEFFKRMDQHDFEWIEARLTPDCVIDAPGFRHAGAEVVVLLMAG